MASGVSPASAHPAGPAAGPAAGQVPWLGILGVILGALISTLSGRITTFGLADVRGAVGAGVDEGAWITTAQSAAQMLIAPFAVWAGTAFGVRRVLTVSIPVLALASFLTPFSTNVTQVIALQFVAGLASGTFIPVTISFIAKSLRGPLLLYGVAAYAFNLELSLNIGASLEGFYSEHLSWIWIFWQNLPLAAAMFACVWFGIAREPINRQAVATFDGWGMAFFCLALALLYAALDQGNRLDWIGSGLIVGLLSAGAILMTAFLLHERRAPSPWLHFELFAGRNFAFLLILLAAFRFANLATAYVIPQYLTQIHGFRALQVGGALDWIAIPQIVFAPVVVLFLRRMDPRYGLAGGFALMAAGALMVAYGLTQVWESDDFLPSQLIQALGQTLGVTSLIYFFVQHIDPKLALSFGALLQSVRLFGGELGVGLMQTFVRVREGVNSNLIGQNVISGDYLTQMRLTELASGVSRQGPGVAQARATGLLNQAVSGQSYVLAYIDAFELIAATAVLALLVSALLKPAPPRPAPPAHA